MNKPASNGNQSLTDSGENKVRSKITKTGRREDINTEKGIGPKDQPNDKISDNGVIDKFVTKDDLKHNQTMSANNKSSMKRLPKDSSTLEKKRPVKEISTINATTSLATEEVKSNKSNLNNVAR